MRRLFPLLLVACCVPSFAAVAVVQEKDGTTVSTLTLTSNTTIGNALGIIVSSATPTTVKIGSQTLSQQGACTPTVSSLKTCAFATSNITVASTSVTCTSCGTSNFIIAVEFSGTNGIEPIIACFAAAAASPCQQDATGTTIGISYRPGYSAEGVLFGMTCSGSSTAPTVTGLTGGGTATPNSNPTAWGVSSGTTLTSVVQTAGCSQAAGIILAFTGTGATQQPSANPNQQENSTEVTSGNATVTATIFNVGDLVILTPWCVNSCGITTLTLGAQNATCPAAAQGSSNTQAGQPGICYVIANTTGSLTVTFTPSGSPAHFQVTYHDFSVSLNTTAAFDTAAVSNCQSSCSEGTTVTLPSVTPLNTGSLLINFVSTLNHATVPHTGSPQWSCYEYLGVGDPIACTQLSTVNLVSWIRSSAGGATTANANISTNNDPYQSVVAAFSLSPPAGPLPPGQWPRQQ